MVISRYIVTNYVKHILTGSEIRTVQGDGLCILHVFVEGIFHLCDVHKSIPDVQEVLENQSEKNKEHYSYFIAGTKDIMVEFETIMKDPLKLYDSDTTDLFLSALTDAFEIMQLFVNQMTQSIGLLICQTKKTPSRKLCTLQEVSHYTLILSSLVRNYREFPCRPL